MIKKLETVKLGKKNTQLFSLQNRNNVKVTICSFGARIISFNIPTKNGKEKDIIVGHKNLKNFANGKFVYGATIGRFANRIANGSFSINGTTYSLSKNEKDNCLHGGFSGFSDKFFKARILKNSLKLTYISPDGEEGFPGKLSLSVFYSLTDKNELIIKYVAKSNKDTIFNPTNHAYFNISDNENIYDLDLKIKSNKMLDVNNSLIPSGNFIDVKNTPYSFIKYKNLGKAISSQYKMIKKCNGFDFCYCLEKKENSFKKVASIIDKKTNRELIIKTSMPGLQVWTANEQLNVDNKTLPPHSAICLESGFYPDSPNHKNFPFTILEKDKVFKSKTSFTIKF